jgi:hypothetical protein
MILRPIYSQVVVATGSKGVFVSGGRDSDDVPRLLIEVDAIAVI